MTATTKEVWHISQYPLINSGAQRVFRLAQRLLEPHPCGYRESALPSPHGLACADMKDTWGSVRHPGQRLQKCSDLKNALASLPHLMQRAGCTTNCRFKATWATWSVRKRTELGRERVPTELPCCRGLGARSAPQNVSEIPVLPRGGSLRQRVISPGLGGKGNALPSRTRQINK